MYMINKMFNITTPVLGPVPIPILRYFIKFLVKRS